MQLSERAGFATIVKELLLQSSPGWMRQRIQEWTM